MAYTFSCPLPNCEIVMSADVNDSDSAASMLVEKAKKHLATIHPDVKKTDEEIRIDITSHMIKS